MRMPRKIVRCERGAYFTTVWIPLVSFKAVRMGSARLQHCPVHQRNERVTKVPDDEITLAIRDEAARVDDGRIP